MDQIKTGALIRLLRQKQGLTQLELSEKLSISDKTVSKWERGCGAPDISMLPALSDALGVDVKALLKGELGENSQSCGNMKKIRFFVCPDCGNVIFSTDGASISCCGKKIKPLEARRASRDEKLNIAESDGELYITADHEMRRAHYISFIAFITGDTLTVKKLYPEWEAQTRLPLHAHGVLYWYCTKHGLMFSEV